MAETSSPVDFSALGRGPSHTKPEPCWFLWWDELDGFFAATQDSRCSGPTTHRLLAADKNAVWRMAELCNAALGIVRGQAISTRVPVEGAACRDRGGA